jgi:hypothetical protein
MDNMNTSQNYNDKNKLSYLEKNFNRVLNKYNSTYKLLVEYLVRNSNSEQKKYFGKVITNGDVNYYVNNYGYTHKYSNDVWSQNHETCPITPSETVSDDVLKKLKKGPDMFAGQPCNIAGKNIMNKKTGEYSWVDIKGYKHIYSTSTWKNRSKSCSIPVLQLEENVYDSIPTADNMQDTSECIQLDVDLTLWDSLAKLNKELISLATKISNEISKLSVKDKLLKEKISEEQRKVNGYINKLDDDYKHIVELTGNYATTYASNIDTRLQKTSTRIRYILWAVLLIMLLLVILSNATNIRFYDFVLAIAIIILLYIISNLIYSYIYSYRLYKH